MPRATAEGKPQLIAGAGKAGAVAVTGGIVIVLLWGLWMSRSGPAPSEVSERPLPETAEPVLQIEAGQELDPWGYEALGSPDPERVAAAVVELRDEWFYADNDVLMASVAEVFQSAVSPGAMFMLNGLSLQRASLWDAPEPNKTYYHTTALSTSVLGEQDDGAVLVEVWAMEVISRRNLIEPMSQWTRERILLIENPDTARWQVVDWTNVEGPVPTLTPALAPSTATELEIDLDGHGRVRDWLGVTQGRETP